MSGPDLELRLAGSDDELGLCCEWVVEALAGDDPHQVALALGGLYAHLVEQGWAAPPKAALLLALQSGAFAADVARLLVPPAAP